ncbi:MAG: cytochrome-c peroxidase, partial [Phycisphaerales bacterium JB061]
MWKRRTPKAVCLALVSAPMLLVAGAHAQPTTSELLPVIFPPENPFSESKRALGKILFWDEQLSSDNTTSCGTCHIPEAGGTDPRFAINPGLDGLTGTPDDIKGSFGVVDADDNNEFIVNNTFDIFRQVTGRAANPTINAAYAEHLFWDGRATSEFIDPETGTVAIAMGGALESQVVGPPLSDVEMAHSSRDWSQITAKLATARPLALATNLTPDQSAALAANPSYPELFEDAFGDPAITAKRIAFAIATYERTLVSDQSPWDQVQAGDPNAMTPIQQEGWVIFQNARCDSCHTPPLFTDNMFRNIGIRPIALDSGRQEVTGLNSDRGRFKTPGLRNAGLKPNFMHSGHLATLTQAVQFYVQPPPFPDNVDPFMGAVDLIGPQVAPLTEFIATGLLDPRVAAGTFPFDRPTLRSELPANPAILGPGDDNGTGFVPTMLANVPPNAGNAEFKVGAVGMNEGVSMSLLISTKPPVENKITPTDTMGPYTATSGTGAAPIVTAFWPVPDDSDLDGQTVYFQWVVDATGARSPVAAANIFCGTGGCAPDCLADVNGDGMLSPTDFSAWVGA